MEFYATAPVRLRAEDLQRHLRIDTLPQWCASIDKVLAHEGDRGNIYSVWGEFRIRREVIRDGVRFSLPGCPNARQWTVTAANGATLAAETRLDTIAVGPIAMHNVRALVAKPGSLEESLLGMTFLERLKSYTVERNRLILTAR